MKSKSPLVMLEQLIMLLVFALAAAMCLQAFALADSQSKTTIARDAAIIEVQQAAEVIKYCGGDMERAAAILGAEGSDSGLSLVSESYVVRAEKLSSGLELMGQARVFAETADGQCLFEVSLGWQEGGGE